MSKHFVWTTIAAWLALTTALSAQQPKPMAGQSQQRGEPAQTVSCVLRVTYDPTILPLDQRTLQNIVQSTGVLPAAVRQATPTAQHGTPSQRRVDVDIRRDLAMIHISVASDTEAAPANLIAAVEQNLQQALQAGYSAAVSEHQSRIDAMEEYLNRLRRRYDQLEQRIRGREQPKAAEQPSEQPPQDAAESPADNPPEQPIQAPSQDMPAGPGRPPQQPAGETETVTPLMQELRRAATRKPDRPEKDLVIRELRTAIAGMEDEIDDVARLREAGRLTGVNTQILQQNLREARLMLAERLEQRRQGDETARLRQHLQDLISRLAETSPSASASPHGRRTAGLLETEQDIVLDMIRKAMMQQAQMEMQLQMLQPPGVTAICP